MLGIAGLLPIAAAAQAAAGQPCATTSRVAATSAPPEQVWASEQLGAAHVAALNRGRGQIIAVLDTGVAPVPALAPGLLPGIDLVGDGLAGATTDCDGHGTFAAGLMGAADSASSPVPGLAPEAQILPVRVAENKNEAPAPSVVAAGIEFAITQGADVILVGPSVADDPALAAAVTNAEAAGVLVVAGIADPLVAGPGSGYPSEYPTVLAVNGVGPPGRPADPGTSRVDVLAPAEGLTGLGPEGGFVAGSSAGYGAAFVAAAGTLLKAQNPSWTSGQIRAQLLRTVTPIDGRANEPGLLNPYAALTLPVPSAQTSVAPQQIPPVVLAPPVDRSRLDAGLGIGFGILVAALAVTAIVFGVRRAKGRQWRPGPSGPEGPS